MLCWCRRFRNHNIARPREISLFLYNTLLNFSSQGLITLYMRKTVLEDIDLEVLVSRGKQGLLLHTYYLDERKGCLTTTPHRQLSTIQQRIACCDAINQQVRGWVGKQGCKNWPICSTRRCASTSKSSLDNHGPCFCT